MTTVGSHMQCRQIVVGDVIHWHVVAEQELDTVEVVPLGGHVEWRQTVLQLEHTGREEKTEGERKRRERERRRQTHRQMDRHTQSIRMQKVPNTERL